MTIKLTREEAIQDLEAIKSFERYARGRLALDMAIEALQTDIVRCRDCKHWKDYECHCESASTDHEGGASYSLDRDANDYCSFGERKE